MMQKRIIQSAYSLTEVLIALGILAVIAIVGVQSFVSTSKYQTVHASARQIESAFDEARSKTLSSVNRTQYGVHATVGESFVEIFTGATYISGDPSNVHIDLDDRTVISEVLNNAGGSIDIVFERLTGRAVPDSTITISHVSDPSETIDIQISSTGLVEVLE